MPPPFPRSLKILANTLIVHATVSSILQLLEDEEDSELSISIFLITCYLYAFHQELHTQCMLYEAFYSNVLYPHCVRPESVDDMLKAINAEAPTEGIEGDENNKEEDGAKIIVDAHPLLNTIYVYDPSDIKLSMQDQFLTFPHEDLRQVLWIGSLVKATGEINRQTLRKFQL